MKTGRSHRERPVFAYVLPWLVALALVSCSAGSQGRLGIDRPPPGVVPALSLAGAEGSGCMDARNPRRWGHGFEVADPWRLEIEPEDIVRAEEVGGIGHSIVHYFGCRRFVIELAVVLDDHSRDPLGDIQRAHALLAVFLSGAPARSALWSLAAAMRISPDEPFVYGKALSLSERDSLSVRFDPTRSDARLMVVYRLGL